MLNYFLPIVEAGKRPKLDTTAQDDLVAGSNGRWTAWTDMIRQKLEDSQEARQLYLENRPDSQAYNKPDDVARSQVRRPVIAQALDSTIAQQQLASFPTDELFYKGKPKNQLANQKLPLYEKHIQGRLSHIDFMIQALKAKLNKALDGTVAVWTPYLQEVEKKTTYEFDTLFGIKLAKKPKAKQKDTIVFEGTDYIPLNFEDWRVDPLVDRLKEANLIWRRWVTVEELQAVQSLANTNDLEPYGKAWGEDDSASRKDTNYRFMGIQPTLEDTEGVASQMVLLYEEWGDFYVDDEFYHNYVLIYSNDKTFHYFGPNPFNHQKKPFTVSPYIPLPGSLYGKSQAHDIIPLAHAYDSMSNNAIETIKVTGNPTFTYLVTDTALMEFFSDGPISLIAGEGVPVQRHDSINPIVWDRSAIQEVAAFMQVIKDEIRESTGGVSYASGGMSNADQERTATETNALVSGTSTRFQLLLLMDEELSYKPYLEMTFANDQQFMTEPVFVEDEVKPITPEMVKMMDLVFDITGSKTIMNRQKEIQDYDAFLQNYLPGLIKNGLAVPNGDTIEFNIPELMKRRLSMSSMRDIDSYMTVITKEQQQSEPQQMGAVSPELLNGAPNGLPQVPNAIPPGSPRDMAAA